MTIDEHNHVHLCLWRGKWRRDYGSCDRFLDVLIGNVVGICCSSNCGLVYEAAVQAVQQRCGRRSSSTSEHSSGSLFRPLLMRCIAIVSTLCSCVFKRRKPQLVMVKAWHQKICRWYLNKEYFPYRVFDSFLYKRGARPPRKSPSIWRRL